MNKFKVGDICLYIDQFACKPEKVVITSLSMGQSYVAVEGLYNYPVFITATRSLARIDDLTDFEKALYGI